MKNIFNKSEATEVINRIQKLNGNTRALWGKMSVDQMLAHCNVTYELAYENKHPKPNAFKKFILTLLVKKLVVNEVPYKKNGQTAPEFVIKEKPPDSLY